MDGSQAVTIVPEALEEFQVQAGGYNAEYGGANAGIVRQQLKTGQSQYRASLRIETDNFASNGKQFLNTYSYGYSDYSLTLGGPVMSDRIRFFFAGENMFQRDPTATFWDGFSFNGLVEDAAGSNPDPTRKDSTGKSIPSVIDIVIPNGNVPNRQLERWAGNGTLTFDYKPIIVRISGSLNYQKSFRNDTPIRNILDQARIPRVDQSSALTTAKVTYLPMAQTFVEATVSYQDQRSKRYDPTMKDDYLAYGDSVANYAKGFQYWERFKSPQDIRTNGFPFARYGSLNTIGGGASNYVKRKQNYFSGQLDVTHQLASHELKGGVSYQRYTIRSFSVGRLEALYGTLLNNPDDARSGGSGLDQLWRNGGLPNNYGYDIYGKETDAAGLEGPKHPVHLSGYVQDKVEFKDLIVNAGLRFDYFDNDQRKFMDPLNPGYDPTNFTVLKSSTKKVPAFKAVSPRLGFSFPVTDRTVFHVQYGKFVQSPQLSTLYVGTAELARIFSGRNFINVPYATSGLDPERATQYEIGFTQQFTDFASFDITTFYKDIQGQIQVDRVTTSTSAVASSYNLLQNGDYATTKGFEFTMRIRRIKRLQATFNYTMSDAQGTGSALTTALSTVEAGPQRPTVISPLSFNQTHRGSINADYRFGENDGGPILQRLGANLLFTFNSGHNFTKALGSSTGGQRGPEEGGILADDDPRTRKPEGAVNSSTTPWVFELNLRVDKTLTIANMFEINVYVYIQNLLNTKNVLNVYSRSGNAEDDGFLSNPALSGSIVSGLGQTYVDLYRAINLKDRQHYWQDQLTPVSAFQGGDLFGAPRQIRVGVNINY
jgi:outer membrane receptor protein involved in Fe transport